MINPKLNWIKTYQDHNRYTWTVYLDNQGKSYSDQDKTKPYNVVNIALDHLSYKFSVRLYYKDPNKWTDFKYDPRNYFSILSQMRTAHEFALKEYKKDHPYAFEKPLVPVDKILNDIVSDVLKLDTQIDTT